MQEFFQNLYDGCEGMIEIRPFPGQRTFFDLDDTRGIEAYSRRHAQSNVYFAVATRDGQAGKKENIISFPGAWADIDYKETSREDFKKAYGRFPCRVSYAVASGNGLHLYWIFKEALGREAIPQIEDVNHRIAHALEGDRAACDAARVLRVPGTHNQKYEHKPW
jgi:hypothetical protein